jgi:phenylalanine-4-hydroxylase
MDSPAAAVIPAVYGASDRPPRGDYSRGGSVQADST